MANLFLFQNHRVSVHPVLDNKYLQIIIQKSLNNSWLLIDGPKCGRNNAKYLIWQKFMTCPLRKQLIIWPVTWPDARISSGFGIQVAENSHR